MFDFKKYLEDNLWTYTRSKSYTKDYKTIRIIGKNKFMMALNLDKKIKHKHIVTCKLPRTQEEADTLFDLTMLNINNSKK